jgi:hypothetical protein
MLLMSRDPIRDYVFPEQTVAMVFNGNFSFLKSTPYGDFTL